MLRQVIKGTLFSGLIALAAPALAQSVPMTREVTIVFDAEVTESAPETLQIDGYTGPVEYPIKQGDPIRFSSTVRAPTAEFFESEANQQLLDENGLFRFDARFDPTVLPTSPAAAIGQITNFDISSPLQYFETFGQRPFVQYGMVYDSKTDTYSIDGTDQIFTGNFIAPGFFFDPDTGTLESCIGVCAGSAGNDPPDFRLIGEPSVGVLRSTGIRIYEVPESQTASSAIAGFFNLVFSGSWNLPVTGGSGGTEVPAPPMMILFGLAALAILRRRKPALV